MPQDVILFRFALAYAGAMVFGLVRQRLGKAIGFGTFIFVALGACGLALSAIRLSPDNPLPLLSAIVTGIGFLGAGALFRSGERVTGFTSAATIWIFAVFGLALGVGEYLVGGLVYGTVWSVTLIDNVLAKRWIGVHQRRLHVEVPLGTTDADLVALGLPERSKALSLRVDRELGKVFLAFAVQRELGETAILTRHLEGSPTVLRMTIESA